MQRTADRRFWLGSFAGVAAGALLTLAAVQHPLSAGFPAVSPRAHSGLPATLAALLTLDGAHLGGIDLARVNLLCAEGLPGSEQLSIPAADAVLEKWVARVASETERYFYKFRQSPGDYNHSEAYFRTLTMVTVLQQDFHVRYNPERIQAPDFRDSRDLFLHGLLCASLNTQPSTLNQPRGTCVSMPVLYVAVGRRLGYPLKLVTAKAHLFARWDSMDGKERFNIEATNQGLNCFPDEYYRTWPVPLSEEEVKSGQYLKSLTPAEELAVFLSARGHCLEAAGRLPEAQLAHAQAHALAPASPVYVAFLAGAVKKEMPDWHRVRVDLGQSPPANKTQLTSVAKEQQ
jgi:hypothetical protein